MHPRQIQLKKEGADKYDQTMTESLVNLVLIFLAYLLIGKVEDIGYRKGYQDGVASKPPRVKIGFKTKQSKDDDTTSIH